MYYDAHTHLNSDQLYPDREQHLGNFADAGGTGLVNIGVNDERNRRAIHIAKQATEGYRKQNKTTDMPPKGDTEERGGGFPNKEINSPKRSEGLSGGLLTSTHNLQVSATIGLHPGEISFGTITSKRHIDTEIQQLEKLYIKHSDYIVGIGECGIDSHFERNDEIQTLQIYAFDLQCQLARKLQLPLIIHSRDNFPLTLEVVKHYPDLKIYFHCRGYSPAEIQQCIDIFPQLRIGFTGNITYPKAHSIRQSFQKVYEWSSLIGAYPELAEGGGGLSKAKDGGVGLPGIHFLLETDAPYLSPQTKRGKQNIPLYIMDTYSYVAEQQNILLATLQGYLASSFQGLYIS